MLYREVTNPPPVEEAFTRTDNDAILSQAAILLVLAAQLRADHRTANEVLPEDELKVMGIPSLSPQRGRIDSQRIKLALAQRFRTSVGALVPENEDVTWRDDIFAELAADHLREPTPLTAASLMEACLRHPHELIRVAAAAAYQDRSSEPEKLLRILEQGTTSADSLTRQLAAIGLSQATPGHPRLRDFTRSSGKAARAGGTSNTAMLIHGTFALGADWWRPGGDFHSYLLRNIRPDLYSREDRFAWSGGYTDAARDDAAADLVAWVSSHNEQGLDLFTHSHGGSVVMQATKNGLQVGELVLLSCPVHFPKYQPDFSRVKKVVSIRVRLDLVILLDRGGQRFSDPRIQENVLPIWFRHAATHDPDVWQNSTYQIPSML